MAEPLIASLADFASIEGVPSEVSLRRLIKDNPDFPAVPGKHGVAYEIDVAQGIAWLKARDAKELEERRRHAEEVRQFGLELLGEGSAADIGQVGLSPAERRQLLEEEFHAIKVAEKRGQLIRKADVEAAFSDVVVADARMRATFAARLAKRVEMTREQIAEIETLMDADRRDFASKLENLAEPDNADAATGAASAV